MHRAFLTITFLFAVSGTALNAFSVNGKLHLSDDWEKVIYLSAIHSLKQLHTASDELLIAESAIDTDGSFSFSGDFLPRSDRIYRLHLRKKNDPISTIIIGGRDENFVHFVMNNSSEIQVLPDTMRELFSGIAFSGHNGVREFLDIQQLYRDRNKRQGVATETHSRFSREKLIEEIRNYCRNTEYDIVRLYGSYFLTELTDDASDLQSTRELLGSVSDTSIPYYAELNRLSAPLHMKESRGDGAWILLLLGSLIGGMVVYLLMRNRNQKIENRASPKRTAKLLSAREHIILEHLKKGKTNQEIADALNIEVSTVKSHANRIYGKLGVQSRKELLA